MPRYALKVEYNGGPYVGWQRQTDLTTVQGEIEKALAKLEPAEHKIAAAGRTDRGVHALGQVAHCDLDQDWNPFRLSEALNYHLKPNPIAIVGCAAVADDFHARFWAQDRRYLYRILPRRAPATVRAGFVWQVSSPLDIPAMQAAADVLIGTHDFTTFRSTICQSKSPVKTLDLLDIEQVDDEIHFHVQARSFLHNQVRSFVGTLEGIGRKGKPPQVMQDALDARDRSACGPVAPSDGLYLENVSYDVDPFT